MESFAGPRAVFATSTNQYIAVRCVCAAAASVLELELMSAFRGVATTAMQGAAGLLLLFAGWGMRDLGEFFANPIRTGFVVLIVLGAALAVILRVETQPIRKGLLATKRQGVELGILLALSVLLLAFLPFADRHELLVVQSPAIAFGIRGIGLVLCGAGGTIRLLALQRLGPQFSAYVTLQPGHRLVQDGIYRRIRHPLYLSLLMVPGGIALVFASQLALPILTLSLIFVADRIRKEERLLVEGFGAEFCAYRARTRMLIPGVL